MAPSPLPVSIAMKISPAINTIMAMAQITRRFATRDPLFLFIMEVLVRRLVIIKTLGNSYRVEKGRNNYGINPIFVTVVVSLVSGFVELGL